MIFFPGLSCKKFLDVQLDKSKLESSAVFATDVNANGAVTGIYFQMLDWGSFSGGAYASVTGLTALSSDEMRSYANSADYLTFYTNSLINVNYYVQTLWTTPYQVIYSANAVIEGLAASKGVTADTKKQLESEARFIRAFCHFYLVNLFGEVPVITTTDYNKNAGVSRQTVDEVYAQILEDLQFAYDNISEGYYLTDERVRANKATVSAMLARVWLYRKDWAKAASYATEVINKNTVYQLENNPDSVFLAPSREAIWQLRPSQPGYNTGEGLYMVLTGNPANSSFGNSAFTPQLLNAYEAGDKRRQHWVGVFTDTTVTPHKDFYFSYKYKLANAPLKEYSAIFRLAEVLLIRAEARAMLNDVSGAQDDIDAIRHRAGLGNTTAADQASLLTAIEQERKVELAVEWGHRWLDLKRWDKVDAALAPLKTGWRKEDALYPVPFQELKKDPHLLPQNPGY